MTMIGNSNNYEYRIASTIEKSGSVTEKLLRDDVDIYPGFRGPFKKYQLVELIQRNLITRGVYGDVSVSVGSHFDGLTGLYDGSVNVTCNGVYRKFLVFNWLSVSRLLCKIDKFIMKHSVAKSPNDILLYTTPITRGPTNCMDPIEIQKVLERSENNYGKLVRKEII